jgi:radical SAM superfamily enzyme YgiQ (UPF0313 family)
LGSKYKILFLGLPCNQSYSHALAQPQYLGYRYLTATLRRHHYDAQIINIVLSHKELQSITFSTRPEWVEHQVSKVILTKTMEVIRSYDLTSSVIGITTSWQHIKLVLQVVQAIKAKYPHVILLLGGVYATLNGRELMRDYSEIDFILAGEAELSIVPFMEAAETRKRLRFVKGLLYRTETHRIIENPPVEVIFNLDDLPFPTQDEIQLIYHRNNNRIRISSSRGCYGRCTFCSINAFQKSINCLSPRMQSATRTADEIEYLNKAYGIRKFVFVDPNFFVSGRRGKQRAVDFAHQLITRKIDISFKIDARANDIDFQVLQTLKKAGLYGIELGVESFDDSVLSILNKRITAQQNIEAIDYVCKLGLELTLSYIFYTPWTTLESIKQTLPIVERVMNKPQVLWFPIFKNLKIMNKTKLFDQTVSDGTFIGNYMQSEYVMEHPEIESIKQKHMAFCDKISTFLNNTPSLYFWKKPGSSETEIAHYNGKIKLVRNLTVLFLEMLLKNDHEGELYCWRYFDKQRGEIIKAYHNAKITHSMNGDAI